MFEGEYSKKVWIATVIMAVCCIGMDIYYLLDENSFMRETVWFTLPIAAFILYKGVVGLIKKIKEEKEEQEQQ